MPEETRIAIVDLADDLQVRKQRIFKVLPRLGIEATQRRELARGNQMVATVTQSEAAAIRAQIEKSISRSGSGDPGTVATAVSFPDDVGYFYVIQLEPQHDPGRFKVGFTMDLDGRLQKHRCSAPFAQYLHTWPCRRVWERAAIDCVTNACEQLHTEVFRATSLDQVASQAQSFFALMPTLTDDLSDEEP